MGKYSMGKYSCNFHNGKKISQLVPSFFVKIPLSIGKEHVLFKNCNNYNNSNC